MGKCGPAQAGFSLWETQAGFHVWRERHLGLSRVYTPSIARSQLTLAPNGSFARDNHGDVRTRDTGRRFAPAWR
jgi:hypothetical protein